MPTSHEIRHLNLLLLIKAAGSVQKLADAVGKSNSQISQLRNRVAHSKTGNPREMGDALARHFEVALGKPVGWMDQPHDDAELAGTTRPEAPPSNFEDRRIASESDWALLQDIKTAMHMPYLAQQITSMREQVAEINAAAARILEERLGAAKARGGHAGGMSAFGELDESRDDAPVIDRAKKSKGGAQ